ncbi:hypothetical protein [Streptomyces sp. NBC_01361]|uniref:hypothetical protein n=1 Tax=Streptomyces sp. NBC_01361 TaxID=2903838 RepID=UPI002E307BAF|nr:hypothetical protein [Streptomyces sp. NBC_01361]
MAVGTSVGLPAGAAVVGLLVQSVPHPDTDVFSVLTRVFLLLRRNASRAARGRHGQRHITATLRVASRGCDSSRA